MKKIKLFSFILVLSILGSLPAFATDATMTAGTNGSSCTVNGASGIKVGTSSKGGDMNITVGAGATKLTLYAAAWKGVTGLSLNISGATTNPTSISLTADGGITSNSPFTLSGTASNFKHEITLSGITAETTITFTSSIAKRFVVWGAAYETSSGSTPSLTLTPTSTSVEAANVANQSITLTTSNFSSSISSVTTGLYSNAECTSAITSGQWVKDITVNAGKTAVTFNVDDNDGAQRQCWLKITATAGSQSASAILPITQAKYSAPTGTFKLYSGDISEGDYVIYYNGKAMNTTVTSNRLQYAEVTPSDNKIINPDESIIWHIAPISETTYWSIYNDAEGKYAGGTSSKNQATMLSDLTSYASWTITGSSTYEFENIGRSILTTEADKKWLRNNGTYGFACYASSTGGALTLYKFDDGKPSAPTFSPAGGSFLEAQSVTISAESGTTIHYTTDGSTPTTSSATYSAAIPVSTTTTIKAIAVKDDKSSSVASATYTITTPKSVDEIWDEITSSGPEDAYVYGYVSQTNVGGYENNFYISVDGSTESNQLYAYRMDMNSYSVAVGDKVILNGDLTIYNNVKEFKYTSATDCGKIVGYTAKGALTTVAVSGTPTKTVYANGETFETAGLVVTATYANGYATAVTADSWECTPATVTASGNISVKATYESVQSLAYSVPVTVASKTLVSIALSYDAVDVYQGLELPKPTVTATYSEGQPEDVTAQAEFTGYDASTTGEQEITVSYTFGGTTKTATYTVTVNPIYNVELAASVARNLIINVVGNTESTDDMIIRGKVSYINNASSNAQTYWISDDGTRTNEVEIYKGKYIGGADFTSANQLRVGDEVVVIGKVIYYNNSTPEFANGKSEVQSLARTPNFEIEDVVELEVGATDLAVADLTVAVEGEGAITLVSGDETKATIVSNAIHAVAPGTVTITANLAADGIYKAASTTFNVTVIAAQTKYAVTFDGNGADGGTAPEAIANQAEGASVTLPENTWTKTNKLFDGWKVINNTTSAEITVTAGAFTMPASAVTIQAQWADPSTWALTYTSNLTLTGNSSTKAYAEKVKITINEVLTEFDALRACTGSAAGSCTVTVPAGTQKLHFHAAAWNAKTSTITVTMGETELLVQALAADAGIKNSSPYTLEGIPYMYYYCIDLSSYTLSDETTITFAAGSDKRFVLFGVNQEGGAVPELQSLAISGDLTNKTYEAGASLNMAGLTVTGTYDIGAPVDVTDQVEQWLYDELQVGDESVTIRAKIGDITSAGYEITGLTVTDPTPAIITDPDKKLDWGTVNKGTSPADKTIAVTLHFLSSVDADLDDQDGVFNIDKYSNIVDGDVITVSVVNTTTVGTYSATLTLSNYDGFAPDKEITLSVKIEDPETPVGTTSKWVVASAVADGDEVLLTGVKGDDTYALSTQANNNRTAVEGSLSEGVFTPGANTMSVTLVEQSTGKYALRTSNGKYLYAASSSANNLKTRDAIGEDGKAVWSISINDNNEASIVANCEAANWRNTMQFNQNGNNAPVFNCYASASQQPIKLYVRKYAVIISSTIENGTVTASPSLTDAGETVTLTFTPDPDYMLKSISVRTEVGGSIVSILNNTFTMPAENVVVNATFVQDPTPPTKDLIRGNLTNGKWGTICPKQTVENVEGAAFYQISYLEEQNGVPFNMVWDEIEGTTLTAGQPYFFIANATEIRGNKTGAVLNEAGDAVNGFHGYIGTSTWELPYVAEYNSAVDNTFIIYNNSVFRINQGGTMLNSERCYIIINATVPSRQAKPQPSTSMHRLTMSISGADAPAVTTGINEFTNDQMTNKVIINGHLFILRGEKMFDATGRLVK